MFPAARFRGMLDATDTGTRVRGSVEVARSGDLAPAVVTSPPVLWRFFRYPRQLSTWVREMLYVPPNENGS